MARNSSGPPFDDPFYRRDTAAPRSAFDDDALPLDAGLTEDEGEEEPQQFRRASKRVPVRRGALPRKTASRVRQAATLLLTFAVLGCIAYGCYRYAMRSPRFRITSESVEVLGEAPNSREQVLQKMNDLVGRNVFQISLGERKRELEKIPWVESASVMRLWPNRLRVMVKERTPVAFVALGERIDLIDAQGVLMEMPPRSDYSFPVILGMNENEPLSTRAPRMKLFLRLVHELDGGDGNKQGGAQYSRNLDEVDLSDPEDIKVLARGGSAPILVHLGNSDFLPRFMLFLTNVQKWEEERGKLESVDLRFGREVILNPDPHAAPPTPQSAQADPQPPSSEPAPKPASPHRPEKKHKNGQAQR
jgi:cell division protein FtsQ